MVTTELKTDNKGTVIKDFDIELDTTDLVCPYPIIKTKKVLNDIKPGQIIHVITTNIDSFQNFPHTVVNMAMKSLTTMRKMACTISLSKKADYCS